ncbi:ROK family protein [Rufibacter sediminis]|uniref:ROK family protein n=1 Tax=Rufibacter sediminis TaxID=2762756 RepID=A0ABR6VRA9_9BACT|nr:ROK family protein [Rufibacter sediminis]MBC3539121.1 ROK family protein [Rufibacter sediminis]
MDHSTVVGIDVGGTHISAALINIETSTLVAGSYLRKEIDTQSTVTEIITNWCEVIQQTRRFNGAHASKIGIAMPGPFDYTKGVSLIKDQNKYDILYNLNVKELLAEQLSIPTADIRFLNDAACFLLGEVFCGAAQGEGRVLGLTLGTGLGSAWCHHGQVKDADLWNAPFKSGIAEEYLSTRWFVGRYQELTGQRVKGVKEIADVASKDAVAQRVFDEFGQNLGQFIETAVHPPTADVLVIGGNISNAYPLFSGELMRHLRKAALPIQIRVAELGEKSALIGAASSWQESLLEKEEALNGQAE